MQISIAAINLAIAVMLGAFGAHGLKDQLLAAQMAWWQTATQYFFIHALGLLAVGVLSKMMTAASSMQTHALTNVSYCLQLGIVLFCGSLYALALGAPRWVGMITPLGGIAFIAGWLLLAYHMWKTT